jgi:hypothetical protein
MFLSLFGDLLEHLLEVEKGAEDNMSSSTGRRLTDMSALAISIWPGKRWPPSS